MRFPNPQNARRRNGLISARTRWLKDVIDFSQSRPSSVCFVVRRDLRSAAGREGEHAAGKPVSGRQAGPQPRRRGLSHLGARTSSCLYLQGNEPGNERLAMWRLTNPGLSCNCVRHPPQTWCIHRLETAVWGLDLVHAMETATLAPSVVSTAHHTTQCNRPLMSGGKHVAV